MIYKSVKGPYKKYQDAKISQPDEGYDRAPAWQDQPVLVRCLFIQRFPLFLTGDWVTVLASWRNWTFLCLQTAAHHAIGPTHPSNSAVQCSAQCVCPGVRAG